MPSTMSLFQSLPILPEHSLDVPYQQPSPSTTTDQLFTLGLTRIHDAATHGQIYSHNIFPHGKTLSGQPFSSDDTFTYPFLTTALGRLSYTLHKFPERAPPEGMRPVLTKLLRADLVLKTWRAIVPLLKAQATQCFHEARNQTIPKTSNKTTTVTVPCDYRPIANAGSSLCMRLLSRACHELWRGPSATLQLEQVADFLQLYCFLWDPVGGLSRPVDTACAHFQRLAGSVAYAKFHHHQNFVKLNWELCLVQLAAEAVYLGCPLLKDICSVKCLGPEQLTYVDLPVDNLPRSELSITSHVLDMVEEILVSEELTIIPITVAMYPQLEIPDSPLQTIIIDGNHRLTAVMLLRYISEAHITSNSFSQHYEGGLRSFCHRHKLCSKWYTVLADAVEFTCTSQHHRDLLAAHTQKVQKFATLSTIPALVVEEETFHTTCTQRPPVAPDGRAAVLLPFHQAIFNDRALAAVFPQAGQVHGRTAMYEVLPLKFASGRG